MLRTNDKSKTAVLAVLGTLISIFQNAAAQALPFDPAEISRLSVDQIPRSVSIRQGADIWFGYNLEKALLFKVWKAAKDKPGLIRKDFKTQSSGKVLFESKSDQAWLIERNGKEIQPVIRYLGCTENDADFELRWELRHPGARLQLSERIPKSPAGDSSRAIRELKVHHLEKGTSLILPSAYQKDWILTGPGEATAKSINGSDWHRLSLR